MSSKRKLIENDNFSGSKKQKYNNLLQLLLDALSCLLSEIVTTIIYRYAYKYEDTLTVNRFISIKDSQYRYNCVPRAIAITENEIYILAYYAIYVISDNSLNRDSRETKKIIDNVRATNIFINKNDLFVVSDIGITIINKNDGHIIKTLNKWKNNAPPLSKLISTDHNDNIYVLVDKTNKDNKVYIFDKNTYEFTGEFNFIIDDRTSENKIRIAKDNKKFYVMNGSKIYFLNDDLLDSTPDHFELKLPMLSRFDFRGITVTNYEIFVTDYYNGCIRVFNKFTKEYMGKFGKFSLITGSNVSIHNDKIFVMSNGNLCGIYVWNKF
jgi:hypothetical protein